MPPDGGTLTLTLCCHWVPHSQHHVLMTLIFQQRCQEAVTLEFPCTNREVFNPQPYNVDRLVPFDKQLKWGSGTFSSQRLVVNKLLNLDMDLNSNLTLSPTLSNAILNYKTQRPE